MDADRLKGALPTNIFVAIGYQLSLHHCGGGGLEASGWLLKARNSEAERQKAQRRVRGIMSLLRGCPPEANLAANLCATQWLRGSGTPRDGWLRQSSGGLLVLCL